MTNARHNFIYAKVKNCNFDLFELCLFSVAKAFIVFAFKTCKWHSQCSPELARSRRQDFDHKTQNFADKSRRRTSLWKEATWPRKTRELTTSWLLRCGLHAMLDLAKKAVWWKILAEPTRGGNFFTGRQHIARQPCGSFCDPQCKIIFGDQFHYCSFNWTRDEIERTRITKPAPAVSFTRRFRHFSERDDLVFEMYTIASIWLWKYARIFVLEYYLFLKLKLTDFLELRSRKTVRLSEQIISAD